MEDLIKGIQLDRPLSYCKIIGAPDLAWSHFRPLSGFWTVPKRFRSGVFSAGPLEASASSSSTHPSCETRLFCGGVAGWIPVGVEPK